MARKNIILAVFILVIIGAIFYFESLRPERKSGEDAEIKIEARQDKANKYDSAKELVGIQGFINSDPFKISDQIGKKVILIDFWTYSCINCQRTTPYLNAWWEKYEDDGLLIIGVHTPEFEFEKKYDNVLQATKTFDIKYPVVQDNDYSTWTAYGNRYWPRKYLIDIDGFIVYDHIGEGGYEETENKIRELLMERKLIFGETGEIDGNMSEPKGVRDVSIRPESPEVYFGAFRNELLANGDTSKIGIQNLVNSGSINLNKLYLIGSWNIQEEYSQNINSGSRVIFKFKARKVNIVAESDKPSKARILLDGKMVSEINIQNSQLYEIISLPEQGEHILEIILEDPNIRLYTFTFS
jgi:thiol-disulfide isomerase/thioredoxin